MDPGIKRKVATGHKWQWQLWRRCESILRPKPIAVAFWTKMTRRSFKAFVQSIPDLSIDSHKNNGFFSAEAKGEKTNWISLSFLVVAKTSFPTKLSPRGNEVTKAAGKVCTLFHLNPTSQKILIGYHESAKIHKDFPTSKMYHWNFGRLQKAKVFFLETRSPNSCIMCGIFDRCFLSVKVNTSLKDSNTNRDLSSLHFLDVFTLDKNLLLKNWYPWHDFVQVGTWPFELFFW